MCRWYTLTLNELGLELLGQVRDEKMFMGDCETTWYLLYRKP